MRLAFRLRRSESPAVPPTDNMYCCGNSTGNNTYQLPDELKFNDNALVVVIVYAILFVIAALGNLTVFITLMRGRHRKSRISLMITHLSVADLLVTFIMIPLEIAWRITVQWIAGNAACKFFLFLRAFGLYLSSNVLVCVSVDRYFAILHPLRVNDARRRGKMMLTIAWVCSLLCALPQSVVFHVSEHPEYPGFLQCVSFGFFRSQAEETAYNLFCVFAMYFIPLLVIIFAYTCIMWEISKKTRETKGEDCDSERMRGRMRLRRSDMSNIERARTRTLRMTVTIVAAFIWCWTPYVVMTLWYMFDRESAEKVDSRLQDGLFIMAVSNSCMNPVVYGSYAMNFKRECRKCFCCLFGSHQILQRTSTDGAGRARGVFLVPKCVFTLVKGGSGVTRSTGVGAFGNLSHNRNQLTINRRNLRPVSSEQLMVRGGHINSDEFHSDPGGMTGVYLVPS